MRHAALSVVILACAVLCAAPARGADLTVGDAAPPLAVSQTLCGDPVESLERGTVYIVEFWAVWSRASMENIAGLSRLQRDLGPLGVRVIGVGILQDPGRAQKIVDGITARWPVDYTIALERVPEGADPRWGGAMTNNWVRATGRCAVPMTFLVDREGRIAWIGHSGWPAGELEEFARSAAAGSLTPEHSEVLRTKWARIGELSQAVRARSRSGDYEGALTAIEELAAMDRAAADGLALAHFEILLLGIRDEGAAYSVGRRAVEGPLKDDAWKLNALAWMIVDEKGVKRRDYDLAIKAATRACELTAWKSGAVLDTLAKAYFDSGERARGLELQEKAVACAAGTRWEHELTQRLHEYRSIMEQK